MKTIRLYMLLIFVTLNVSLFIQLIYHYLSLLFIYYHLSHCCCYDQRQQKVTCFVDLRVRNGGEEEANEVLVVMLVGLRGHWKATISYYLIRSLSAETLCLLPVENKVTVRFSEGPFFRRFIVPKVHCSEKKVYYAEGLLVRRVIYPK